jgi:hypothetical protein
MLEVDAISVHEGQPFFAVRYRVIPIPPNSCDHSSMIQDQVDSFLPDQYVSEASVLQAASLPSTLTILAFSWPSSILLCIRIFGGGAM